MTSLSERIRAEVEKEIKDKCREVVRAATLTFPPGVVTGTLKNNWYATTADNIPATCQVNEHSRVKDVVLKDWKLGEDIVCGNPTIYAKVHEFGSQKRNIKAKYMLTHAVKAVFGK